MSDPFETYALPDEATFKKLLEAGHISKSTLDKIYTRNTQEAIIEDDATTQATADEISSVIKSDPKLQDVAERVAENFVPVAPPTPSAKPTPPALAKPSATPIPTATPTQAVPMEAPASIAPQEEAVLAEAEQASQGALITGAAAQEAAETGNQTGVLDLTVTAMQQRRQAALAEAGAISAGAKREMDVLGAAFDDATVRAAAADKKRTEYQGEFDRLLKVQEEAINTYSDSQINPNRVYANMSTPVKILSALSVFLGGVGHGMGGGENKGYERVRQAINDDIKLQKDQISILGNAIEFRQNLLSSVRARIGDQLAAEKVTEAIMLNRTKLQLEGIAAKTKSAQAQAAAQGAVAKINLDIANVLRDANAGLSSQAMGMVNATDPNFDDYSSLPKDVQSRMVRGLGLTVSPTQQRIVSDQLGAYNTIAAEVEELKNLIKENGTTVWPTTARNLAQNKWGLILGKIKQAEKLGALDAGVDRYMENIIPKDPGGVSALAPWQYITKRPEVTLARLDDFTNYTKRNFINNIKGSVARFDPRFLASLEADRLQEQDRSAGRAITNTIE